MARHPSPLARPASSRSSVIRWLRQNSSMSPRPEAPTGRRAACVVSVTVAPHQRGPLAGDRQQPRGRPRAARSARRGRRRSPAAPGGPGAGAGAVVAHRHDLLAHRGLERRAPAPQPEDHDAGRHAHRGRRPPGSAAAGTRSASPGSRRCGGCAAGRRRGRAAASSASTARARRPAGRPRARPRRWAPTTCRPGCGPGPGGRSDSGERGVAATGSRSTSCQPIFR